MTRKTSVKYYRTAFDWLILLSLKISLGKIGLINSETIEVPNQDFHSTANFLFEALDFELDDILGLLNHGCWCSKFNVNGAPSLVLGGIAQDSLDAICQSWSRSRFCNDKLTNGECNQVDTTFSAYSINDNSVNDIFECDEILNQDLCENSSCSIDLYFANQIKTFLFENPNFTFQSNLGSSCDRIEPRSPYAADECQGNPFTSPGSLRVFSNTRFFVENCSSAEDATIVSKHSNLNSTTDYNKLKLSNPRFSNGKFWNENGFTFPPERAIDGIIIGDPLSDIAHDSKDDTERHFMVDFDTIDFNGETLDKNYKQFIHKVMIYPRRKIYDRYADMIVYLNDCDNWRCTPIADFTAAYVRNNLNIGLEFDCSTVSANLQDQGVRLEKVNVHQLEDSSGNKPDGFRHRIQIAEIEVYGIDA